MFSFNRLLTPTLVFISHHLAVMRHASDRVAALYLEKAEIGPAEVIHERTLDALRRGLVPYWAKDMKIGYSLINAKAETVAEKPAFRGVQVAPATNDRRSAARFAPPEPSSRWNQIRR